MEEFKKHIFIGILRMLTPYDGAKSSHENKKALSPFYHENVFDRKWMEDTPVGELHSFSIKNIYLW